MTSDEEELVGLDDKKIKKNMVLSTVYKPISMIISLIYVPVFLACLGEEKYGIWVTISSVLAWLTQFDVGIGNGLRNKLAEYYARGEKENSEAVVSTAYRILSGISLGIFVVFFFITMVLDLPAFLNLQVTSEPVNVVLIIAAACVCLNFVLGLCGTIFYAIQESSVVALKGIVVQAAQLLAAVILTVLSQSSLLLVAALYGLAEVLVNLIFSAVLFGKNRFLRPKFSKYKKSEVRGIVSLGFQFFILQICALVIYSVDNMIISKYIGAAEVTPYSIVHSAFSVIIAVHTALNMPMWSAYTAALSTKDYGALRLNFKRITWITILLCAGTILAIPLFRPLARIWLQKDLFYAQGLVELEAVYTILALVSNTFSSFLSGVNYVKKTVYVSVAQAIVNIPISVFCATSLGMGIVGVKIGSVIALAISAITNPIWCLEWKRKQKHNKE